VERMLHHAIAQEKDLQIQTEIGVTFQGKTIYPDIMVFQQGGDGHVVSCLKNHGTLHYLIEVKRPEQIKQDSQLYKNDDEALDFSNKPPSKSSKQSKQIPLESNLSQNMQ